MNLPKPRQSRRGKGAFAEVRLALGPAAMGEAGDGSYAALYGHVWAGLIDRNGLCLYRQQGAGWQEVAVPPLAHPVREIRHLGLAFDQSARHIVAYERGGEVWVRQWDTGAQAYVMRGPWPGVDPLLVMDATAHLYLADSDLVLYYLSPDRLEVRYRVQRELYAVERALYAFAAPVWLDQAVSLPYQVALFLGDESGQRYTLRSGLYPIHLEDSLSGASQGPGGGLLEDVQLVEGLPADLLAGSASGMGGGSYELAQIQEGLSTDLLAGSASGISGGSYELVQIQEGPPTDLLAGSGAGPSGGSYAVVVLVEDFSTFDALSGAASGPGGGSYTAV